MVLVDGIKTLRQDAERGKYFKEMLCVTMITVNAIHANVILVSVKGDYYERI